MADLERKETRKRKVPEFMCPVKYRASLPEHTSILPSFYAPTLPSFDALLQYRPTCLESSNVLLPPFDPLASKLADFTNFDAFLRPASTPPATESGPGDMADVDAAAVDNPADEPLLLQDGVEEPSEEAAPIGSREESKTIRISREPVTLVSFDHDPELAMNTQLILKGAVSTEEAIRAMLYTPAEHALLGEWEARELGKTEHNYYVIDGAVAHPVERRLQLKRKRNN